MVEELVPDFSMKKIKIEHISGLTVWNVINLFLLNVQVGVYQHMLKLRCWPLALSYIKVFWATKKGLELVSLSHFRNDIWRKIFLTLFSINYSNLIACLPLLLKILGNMYIAIICRPVCDVIKFEIKLG